MYNNPGYTCALFTIAGVTGAIIISYASSSGAASAATATIAAGSMEKSSSTTSSVPDSAIESISTLIEVAGVDTIPTSVPTAILKPEAVEVVLHSLSSLSTTPPIERAGLNSPESLAIYRGVIDLFIDSISNMKTFKPELTNTTVEQRAALVGEFEAVAELAGQAVTYLVGA